MGEFYRLGVFFTAAGKENHQVIVDIAPGNQFLYCASRQLGYG